MYPVVEHDSRDGVHFYDIHASWSGTYVLDEALQIHRRLGVHETQGYELGDSSRFLLDAPQHRHVVAKLLGSFTVTELTVEVVGYPGREP